MPSITLDDGKKIDYKKPITGEEIAKNIIWSKKNFREIYLFDFTSFFGLDFF